MSKRSIFKIEHDKYVFVSSRLTLVALDEPYTKALIEKLSLIEAKEGSDTAEELLASILANEDLSTRIRRPVELDELKLKNLGNSNYHHKYGKKINCECGQSYYNLHGKIKKCPDPNCKKSI